MNFQESKINFKESARRRMTKALLREMKETHYSKVKVSDIIRIADVNRSTFYRNFEDIFDMYKKICNEYIDFVIEPVRYIKNIDTSNRQNIFNYIKNYRNHIEECLPILKILTGENGESELLFNLRNALSEETERISNEILENDNINIKLFCDCISYYFPILIILKCIKPISLEHFEKTDFSFDINKSFVENAAELIDITKKYNNKKNTISALTFIFRCWEKSSFSMSDINKITSVSDLMNHLRMTRTIFYKYYPNMENFIEYFYSVFAYVFSDYLDILLSSNPTDIKSLLRNEKSETKIFKKNILKDIIKTPAFFTFISYSVGRTINNQIKKLEKNRALNENDLFCLEFYIISITSILFEYFNDFDEEKFIKNFTVYYEKLKDDNVSLS